MRKLRSNRRLGIESLENRVVFANDLVMIDVDLLVRWKIIDQDSDFAIEHKNTSVSVSRDRLTMLPEGERYLNGLSVVPSNALINVTPTEKLASISSSLDSAVATHETAGTPIHPADNTVTSHLTRESSHPKTSPSTLETDLLISTSLLTFGPSSTEPIDATDEEGTTPSFVRDFLASVGPDMQFLDQLAQIQPLRSFELTASATKPDQSNDSSEFVKPLDESLAAWGIRRTSGEFRSLRGSSEPRFDKRHGTDWIEAGQRELLADPFNTISLPIATTDPVAHSWSLLFGVVQPSSSLSADVVDSELAGVRRAVLEIVAESERANLPSAEMATLYSSSGWKATSILAAAFAAVFYRTHQQPDAKPALLARLRKQRLPSNRPRH